MWLQIIEGTNVIRLTLTKPYSIVMIDKDIFSKPPVLRTSAAKYTPT